MYKHVRHFNHSDPASIISHGRPLGEDKAALGALLPNQEQLVLFPIIDSQFSHGTGSLGNDLVLADAAAVAEELFL